MFRPTTAGPDLDLVTSCMPDDPTTAIDAERYRRELAEGCYRPEWTWLYQPDERPLGRALWWAPAHFDQPVALDCLWVDPSVPDRESVGAGLLDAGHEALIAAGCERAPDYHIDVATDWRSDPAAVSAVEWRQRAAARAGLTDVVERLSLAWHRGTPLPARSERVTFRPADDAAFLAAFAAVARGSLDVNTRRMLDAVGADRQAADDLDFYLSLPGERDWWRLAYVGNELVGLVIPSRSAYDASVSYLGVVPEARGHGYVDDLLAEITHFHAVAGAERITGTTDTTNAPMAAAFRRGGYEVTKIRFVMSQPQG
jgi:ribosomal protein S18 acetylase RimI-like enzyme